ncbi:MAG TPA: hypothetical protein PKC43_08470 [Phycisphaerales bacterium]|nr:hypothetical protein [Phycisphaerales bacterium]HMP37469.1 hypothetical protein [Phycisphaerales bacterium]
MELSVQLTPSAARSLHAGRGAPGTAARDPDLDFLAQRLRPVHPGATEPALQVFFTLSTGGAEEAQRLAEQLRRNPHVEAAYVKPSDEPPELPKPM